MSSILTNTSSMVALQTMRSINKDLAGVQSNIATGKTVASAADNAAFWSISKVMESDVQGFKAVNGSLAFADSAVNIARVGAETVTDLLQEVKAKIISGIDGTADATTIGNDITNLTNQIAEVVNASQFNGANYLTAASPANGFLASINRTGPAATTPAYIVVADQSAAVTTAIDPAQFSVDAAGLTAVETQISAMTGIAAVFGQAANRIEIQSEFNKKVSDSFKSGIGAITDTDMEEASARLQALQVQQQLGVQALSIANQQPQTLLSLFR